jgi:Translation initiation factor eIF3 subunit.
MYGTWLCHILVFAVTSHDLKKLKTTVENMFLEKTKAEKGDKTKKSKGKGKVKLKVEGDHVSKNL